MQAALIQTKHCSTGLGLLHAVPVFFTFLNAFCQYSSNPVGCHLVSQGVQMRSHGDSEGAALPSSAEGQTWHSQLCLLCSRGKTGAMCHARCSKYIPYGIKNRHGGKKKFR